MVKQHLFNYLYKKNNYFQQLSGKNQAKFARRCFRFMRSTTFISSDEIELSNEMKVLTSSAFIQLTYGLRRYRLNWFQRIKIVHKPYRYKMNNVSFHGDTNPVTKQINMVWPVILKGFEIPDDALNLSIHELAHVIVLENSKSFFFYSYFNQRKWSRWKKSARKEMEHLKSGRNSFFRSYGSRNLMEFFAVSTEAFFEQSAAYSIKYPKLFEAHCLLLNQDPRNFNAPRLKKRLI